MGCVSDKKDSVNFLPTLAVAFSTLYIPLFLIFILISQSWKKCILCSSNCNRFISLHNLGRSTWFCMTSQKWHNRLITFLILSGDFKTFVVIFIKAHVFAVYQFPSHTTTWNLNSRISQLSNSFFFFFCPTLHRNRWLNERECREDT